MNAEEFRRYGKDAIDYIADYLENIRDRPVLPSVEPGYLQNLLPKEAPEEPEKWEDIMKDMEKFIMPGMTHWQSPHFHAYYPAGQCYPSIMGELISAGLGIVGFTWLTSPACAELEITVMDWLGRMIGLPESFLNCGRGPGGGIIQGSASETVLVCLLAAKERKLKKILQEHPDWEADTVKQKMVAYSSDQSNSSIEKAGRLGSMKMRLLKTDNNCKLRGDVLLKAVKEDVENGLIPTFLCATLGTTATCAFDRIDELGPICQEHDIWLHIDAAYAGAAFVCPEYRHYMKGVEKVDSFNMNPHKWLIVNFDCSAFWIKDSNWLIDALNVDRIYLKHHKMGMSSAPDHRNWEIPLGRRFRSLKLWFTLRSYGAKGIQKYIRRHVYLAKEFEKMVRCDNKFEIPFEQSMGLVCFRLKGPNSLTKKLLDRLTARKKIYVVAGAVQNTMFIRFIVCARECELKDIEYAWHEIQSQADEILREETEAAIAETRMSNGRAIESFLNNNLDDIICKKKIADDMLMRVDESELYIIL